MFEKVNPSHPDKVADRIAGAIVDLAYSMQENPKVAAEVLIGHGQCTVIIETSVVSMSIFDVADIVGRISGNDYLRRYGTHVIIVPQDKHLADNQSGEMRCGDNGIFLGIPIDAEEERLTAIAELLYAQYPADGKFILDWNENPVTGSRSDKLIVCQSHMTKESWECFKEARAEYFDYGETETIFNPLGYWTGGIEVDSGATNRKLGSDMGRAVTGGGLHGKDLSKADVSVNIYAHLLAQRSGEPVELMCAIGDRTVGGRPYSEIVKEARDYIEYVGGFEKFAEWGLIR